MKFWFNLKSKELKTFSDSDSHANVMGMDKMCRDENGEWDDECTDFRTKELQNLGWVRGWVRNGDELNLAISKNFENSIENILSLLPSDYLRVRRLVIDIDGTWDLFGRIHGDYEVPVFLDEDEDALQAWNNKDDAFRKYANILRRIGMKMKFSSRDVVASKELWVAAYERLIEKFMEKNGWSYEEATEYVDNHSELVDREYEDSFARAIDSAELRFKASERKRRLVAAVKQKVLVATGDEWLAARKRLTYHLMKEKGWNLLTTEQYLDENPELVENEAYESMAGQADFQRGAEEFI